MSENPEIVASDSQPVTEKPARRVRPRRVAAVAGSVLLAGALVAGVCLTVVTVRDADRDPGAPTWKFPAAAKADPESEKDTKSRAPGLSALFLPYAGDGSAGGHERGPDIGEFGSDVEFTGDQAVALSKESIKDLPGSTRREMEKMIDKQRIQGMAMRSYLVRHDPYSDGGELTVGVTLSRMENRTAVRRLATGFNDFLAATDVFRKGPRIKGHKDARCFLTPKGDKEDLGLAFCTAYVGDVLVSATADGPDPISGQAVATFFAAQLDRIDDPGQAV